ncbi:MAG: hypothetical protein HZB40_09930 [Rhodocyclales bacterium]|nr:hypothetical protein [Rhodocyclales bacterium]
MASAIVRAMRFLCALLLAIAIPFNAAFAAAAGVCDALENAPLHGAHFGHHGHAHDHDHDAPATPDPAQPGSDHNHSHVHPLFSPMPPAAIVIHRPIAAGVAPPLPDDAYVSALSHRLDRPPRPAPVA